MKNKKGRIVATIIMTITILGSIRLFEQLLLGNSIADAINQIETFHDMPEDSIEVIGYGSSRMWRSIDSMEMYKNYGIGTYNYGAHWQQFNTTYLFFLDSLKTQSPKVVIFEMNNVNDIIENSALTGEIYYTKAIENKGARTEYLSQCFGDDIESYLSYYFFPILEFHSNWANINIMSIFEKTNDEYYYGTMGYFEFDIIGSVDPVDFSLVEELEIDEESIIVLDSIVDICNKNDIEIIFYTSPHADEFNYSVAITEYAEENDCVYFNMNDYLEEIEIDWTTDFKDISHLNDSGAEKVSNFLGEYIVNNYDVTDMRTVEGNMWEYNLID